jgi:hypothetical protein
MLANDLHRLNQSVMKAVEAGVSVELVRSARHHGGDGNWGDLLIPVIVRDGVTDGDPSLLLLVGIAPDIDRVGHLPQQARSQIASSGSNARMPMSISR